MKSSDASVQLALRKRTKLISIRCSHTHRFDLDTHLPEQNEIPQTRGWHKNTVEKCVAKEKYKEFVVGEIDAIVHPRTVVIHFQDTRAAHTTVMCPIRFDYKTFLAISQRTGDCPVDRKRKSVMNVEQEEPTECWIVQLPIADRQILGKDIENASLRFLTLSTRKTFHFTSRHTELFKIENEKKRFYLFCYVTFALSFVILSVHSRLTHTKIFSICSSVPCYSMTSVLRRAVK